MVTSETTDPVVTTPPEENLVDQLKDRYIKTVMDACTLCVMISGMLPDDTSWAKNEKFNDAIKVLSKDIRGCYKTNAKLYDEQITSAAIKRAEESYVADTGNLSGQDENPDSVPQE